VTTPSLYAENQKAYQHDRSLIQSSTEKRVVTHSSLPRQAPVLEQYQQSGKGEICTSARAQSQNKILSRKHHPLTAGKCPHRQLVIDKQPRSLLPPLLTTYHYNTTTTITTTTYYQNDPRNRNHLHRTTPQLRKPPPPSTPYSSSPTPY